MNRIALSVVRFKYFAKPYIPIPGQPLRNLADTSGHYPLRPMLCDKAEGDLTSARQRFEEALQIDRKLRDQLDTPQSLAELVVSLYRVATVTLGREQMQYSREGLDGARQLAIEFPDYPDQLLEAMEQYYDNLTAASSNDDAF